LTAELNPPVTVKATSKRDAASYGIVFPLIFTLEQDVFAGREDRHLRADRQILDSFDDRLSLAPNRCTNQEAKPARGRGGETPGVRCIADRCSCNGRIAENFLNGCRGAGGFDLLRRGRAGRGVCSVDLAQNGRRRPSVVIFRAIVSPHRSPDLPGTWSWSTRTPPPPLPNRTSIAGLPRRKSRR